jgi:hypothetical protein
MPLRTQINLKGRYSFYDSIEEEDVVINVDGDYEISTIIDRNHLQTVLFKVSAIGPSQIELYCNGHPTPDEVIEMLQAGNFRTW